MFKLRLHIFISRTEPETNAPHQRRYHIDKTNMTTVYNMKRQAPSYIRSHGYL